MSTRKYKNHAIRKLTKVGGNSLSVILPKEDVTVLGWKDKQKVTVKRKGGKLIISDWKPSRRRA